MDAKLATMNCRELAEKIYKVKMDGLNSEEVSIRFLMIANYIEKQEQQLQQATDRERVSEEKIKQLEFDLYNKTHLLETSMHVTKRLEDRERVLREALEKIRKREIHTTSFIENGETINKFSYTDIGKIAREALEASK